MTTDQSHNPRQSQDSHFASGSSRDKLRSTIKYLYSFKFVVCELPGVPRFLVCCSVLQIAYNACILWFSVTLL